MVAVFASNNFITSMFCTTFAPITAVLVNSYVDLAEIWATILLQIIVIEFFVIGVFVNYLNDRFGLRFSIWACTIPFLTGCWIRLFQGSQGTGFTWLLIGQIIACFGISFVMSTNAKLSSTWFPDKERATAISIVQMTGVLGTLASFIMAPLFVQDYEKSEWNPELKQIAYSQINKYILVQNFIVSVIGVITMVLARPKPEHPPNEGV